MLNKATRNVIDKLRIDFPDNKIEAKLTPGIEGCSNLIEIYLDDRPMSKVWDRVYIPVPKEYPKWMFWKKQEYTLWDFIGTFITRYSGDQYYYMEAYRTIKEELERRSKECAVDKNP